MQTLFHRLARRVTHALVAAASAALLIGPIAHAQAAQQQAKPATLAT